MAVQETIEQTEDKIQVAFAQAYRAMAFAYTVHPKVFDDGLRVHRIKDEEFESGEIVPHEHAVDDSDAHHVTPLQWEAARE